MSGRQIGSAVGFVVGLYVGNPQLGMAIGGMIGGAVDPDQIQGNKIGSVPAQRSNPGAPQPVVLGTSLVSDCLIMSQSEDMIVKEKTDPGKGSGTEVINEVLYRHVTIRVCRSSLAEDCAVQGIVTVYFDGNIVYDVTPESLLTPADNAKWKKDWTFYYGGPDQGTDPTEESYLGVGNVSAHRQICRVVGKRINLTDYGNRMPTVEVVVSACPVEPPNFLLVTGNPTGDGAPMFSSALAQENFAFTGIAQSTGATLQGGYPEWYQGTWLVLKTNEALVSNDNRASWQSIPFARTQPNGIAAGEQGWLLSNSYGGGSSYNLTAKGSPEDGFEPYTFATTEPNANGEETYMCRYAGGYYWIDTGAQGRLVTTNDLTLTTQLLVYLSVGNDDVGAFLDIETDAVDNSIVYAVVSWNRIAPRLQVRKSTDGGETFPEILIDEETTSPYAPRQILRGGSTIIVHCWGGAFAWTNEDGFSEPHATGMSGDKRGTVIYQPPGRQMAYVEELETFYLICGENPVDPSQGDKCVSTLDGITFSAPVSLEITNAIGIAASSQWNPTGGGMIIPDAPGYYYDPITGEQLGPANGVAQLCGTTLANVLRWLGTRGALEPEEIDASEQEDVPVRGITFQTTNTCKAELEPLRLAHFIDPADFDGALRFRTRGAEDVDMVIDPDALVFTEDEEEDSRLVGQDVEFPKRHHLEYLSLDLRYIRSTATSPDRISIDRSVVGESRASINEVFTKAEATYITAIQHKQQWMSREGGRKFGTGLEYIQLVGASLISLDGKRGRIEQYSIDLNQIWFEKVPYDRASAMRARVVVAEAIGPRPPASQVRGPSISAVLNAPVIVDANDKAGVTWACCGPMRGWRGAQLQMRRPGGTWENGPIIDSPAVMGELTTTLPAASRYVQDNTNVLRVTLYRADAAMDSTDFSGLMAERNVWAIQYPDGTVELGQAQNSIEIADRQWELTGLMRGGLDTVPGEHLAGAKFILLTDALRFVAIRPDDVGKTLEFRAVSTGTDPDLAEIQSITFTTIESLREWQPYNIEVTPDGLGGYCVAWIGRARLGSSRTPIHSQWFEGYRVTFTIGSTVHEVDTTALSICASAATMLEAFGPGHGIPTVTVRARSRVATNDDDFDSPPGSPTGDPFPSYPATIIGEPGEMYEGEGVLDYLGPMHNPPFQAYGGKTEEYFTGYIARNVTCQGSAPGSGIMVGVPLTAETENADTTMWASGPDVIGDPLTITDSVTVLPMPAFAVMDELSPWGDKALVTLVTPTPRTTKRITGVGLGGLRSRAGFSTGERRCEFTIDNMPAGGRIAIGVLAAGVGAHLAPGTGGSFAHTVIGNGTFAVEVDATTGAIEVFELGVGLVASGTLPLTYAHDGKYRFAWVANSSLHPAPGATVQTNQGNESWAITPTAGFGGVPNEAHVIPCGWDAEVAAANGYRPQGTQSLTLATAGGFSGTSVVYAYSEFAKASGQWRIGMAAETNGFARIGLCKAGHTGLLGQGGDSFGMSYDFSVIGSPQLVFDTTWVGQIRIPHPFYAMDRKIIFVCDFDAHTVEVWGKPQFSDYILLTVLTGLPSGSWVPAGNHAVELINGAPEIPGATDWSVTKTP